MGIPIVFVDANVLYSKTLRDWLFLLRRETRCELFTVASSNDVIAEVLYWSRKNNPSAPGQRTGNIKEIIEKALDETVRDFPAGMVFPGDDEHDTHVYAASVTCEASYLVTDDQGFHNVADELPYEVHSADSFFQLIAENAPEAVDEVINQQLAYYRKRENSRTLREALILAKCPTFAEIVHQHLEAMSAGSTTAGIAASVEPEATEDVAETMQPLQS
ncbi:type II toxin-antitoxin system VapC family toxin [Salinibacterium sp. SWN1162]|uniref:type II toxin-antitoxin system VapC family toxin n=1 Tax=Salinibacterium sp. SWN1162 TaxID=2792053 RepID=UPI0018CF9D25|nr:type II toxin-antitoxin system VapC family toxin [Salinibacterium sp. SWN1162]MBH0008068.1 type II toxin-antitoxin system VapC family toxin [Salinibacterium sp. SWN1162]